MHSVLCIVVVTTLLVRSRVAREAKAHRCLLVPFLKIDLEDLEDGDRELQVDPEVASDALHALLFCLRFVCRPKWQTRLEAEHEHMQRSNGIAGHLRIDHNKLQMSLTHEKKAVVTP